MLLSWLALKMLCKIVFCCISCHELNLYPVMYQCSRQKKNYPNLCIYWYRYWYMYCLVTKSSTINSLCWPISTKNTTMLEDIETYFLSIFVKFLSEKKSKISQPIRGCGGHLCWWIGPKKHKVGAGRWVFSSCQVSSNSVPQFLRSQKWEE